MGPSPQVKWLYPNASSTLTVNTGDTIELSWESNVKNPKMNLWCRSIATDIFEPPLINGYKAWKVDSVGSYALNLSGIPRVFKGGCHVGFYRGTGGDSIRDSPGFDITFHRDQQPKTWGKKVAHQLSTSPEEGFHVTSTANPIYSQGLSSGAIAVITVPVVIGVLFLAAIAVFFYLRYRRRRRRSRPTGSEIEYAEKDSKSPPSYDPTFRGNELDGTPRNEAPANYLISEAPSNISPVELPSSNLNNDTSPSATAIGSSFAGGSVESA